MEKTAASIAKLLDKRIYETTNDHVLSGELRFQKELILKGEWHEIYETLNKGEST